MMHVLCPCCILCSPALLTERLTPLGVCDDAGAAYVYKTYDSGEKWEEKAKLLASDGAGNDEFGVSVSVHNDMIVVGAYWDNNSGGINAGEGRGQSADNIMLYQLIYHLMPCGMLILYRRSVCIPIPKHPHLTAVRCSIG